MKRNSFFGSDSFQRFEQAAVVGSAIFCAVSCQRSLNWLNESTQKPPVTIQPITAQKVSNVLPSATHLPIPSTPTTTARVTATETPILPVQNTETPLPPTETESPTPTEKVVAVPVAMQTSPSLPTILPIATLIPGKSWDEADVVVAPQPTVESYWSLAPGNVPDYTYTVRDQYIGAVETRIVKTEIHNGSLTVIWVSVVSPKDYVADLCFMPCRINFIDRTFTENIGFVIPEGSIYRFEPGVDASTASDSYGRHYNMVFLAGQEVVFGIVFRSARVEPLQSVEIPTKQQAMRFTNVFVPYFAEAHYKHKKAIKEQSGSSTP